MTAVEHAPKTSAPADWDFSYLEVEDRVVRFDMHWVTPTAYLMVKVATQENSKYFEASDAMTKKHQGAMIAAGSASRADLDRDRDFDRALYPKHVVVDWGGMYKRGSPEEIPFSYTECKKFFAQLPAFIFNKVRAFCLREENFLDPDETFPDPVTEAGN